MTKQETATQIFNIMESERTDSILNQYAEKYLVIPRSDLNELDNDFKNTFADILEELPAPDKNYVVMVRDKGGVFRSG